MPRPRRFLKSPDCPVACCNTDRSAAPRPSKNSGSARGAVVVAEAPNNGKASRDRGALVLCDRRTAEMHKHFAQAAALCNLECVAWTQANNTEHGLKTKPLKL